MSNYFRIGANSDGSYRNAGRSGLVPGKQAVATGKSYSTIQTDISKRNEVKAKTEGFRSAFRVTASGGGGEGGFQTNRFTPPSEKLDRDTFLDDIVPKGDGAQIRMFERIYREDAVSGSATDLIATIPWSGWTLSGIDDPAIMRIYEEAMERFDPEIMMPDITRDFLKVGRSVMSMVFSSDQNTWTDFIPVDPLFSEIIPIPMLGFDPKVNMLASPEMEVFLASKDPRDREALSRFPAAIRKQLKGGKAELDPLTTLYLRRRTSMTDWKGTSLYLRILPYYALERALLTSTISAARRRTRSILHITAGTDTWEPSPQQMQDIITEFETSEEDPVGAIIATRTGVECNEVRSGGDFWKISEEADFINNGKLKALGLSESFMSGEASVNNIDATKSVFVESEKQLRNKLTIETFNNKIFENLARAHGFRKRKKSDVVHGVRTETLAAPGFSEAMSIPKSELLIPTIHWTKTLSPESDSSYMEILKSAQDAGVPVTLKMWASAAGIDLETLEQTLPEDKELRDRFKKFLPKPAAPEGDGGGFGSFGSATAYAGRVEVLGAMQLGSILRDDPKNLSVLGIPYQEINTVVAQLTSDNRSQRMLRDDRSLSGWLYSRYQGDMRIVDHMRYLLTRMGFADCVISAEYLTNLGRRIHAAIPEFRGNKAMIKKVQGEIELLTTIYKYKSDRSTADFRAEQVVETRQVQALVAESVRRVPVATQNINPRIYTGV